MGYFHSWAIHSVKGMLNHVPGFASSSVCALWLCAPLDKGMHSKRCKTAYGACKKLFFHFELCCVHGTR